MTDLCGSVLNSVWSEGENKIHVWIIELLPLKFLLINLDFIYGNLLPSVLLPLICYSWFAIRGRNKFYSQKVPSNYFWTNGKNLIQICINTSILRSMIVKTFYTSNLNFFFYLLFIFKVIIATLRALSPSHIQGSFIKYVTYRERRSEPAFLMLLRRGGVVVQGCVV